MLINTANQNHPCHVATGFINAETGELSLRNIYHCQIYPVSYVHGTLVYFNNYFHLEKPFGDGVLFKGVFTPGGSCVVSEIHREITGLVNPAQLRDEILKYRKEWPDFF